MLFAEINNMWPDEIFESTTFRESCGRFSFQKTHLNKDIGHWLFFFLQRREKLVFSLELSKE